MANLKDAPETARFLRFYALAGAGWMLFCLPLVHALARGELSAPLASVSCGFLFVAVSSLFFSRVLLRNLRKHRELFEATFEQASIGMAHLTTEGGWLRVNPAFCRMLGYSEEEFTTLSYRDVTHPDDLEKSRVQIVNLLEGRLPSHALEKRYLHKDGHPIWSSLTLAPLLAEDGAVAYLIAVVEDISERKKAEEELLRHRQDLEVLVARRSAELSKSEQRLKEAQVISHVGNWELDLATGALTWSDELYRIVEADPAVTAPSLDLFLQLHPPEERQDILDAYAACRESGALCSLQHRLVFPDGRVKHLREHWRTHLDTEGRGVRRAGTVQDVTSLWETEEKLRQFSRVMEQVPVSVIITDLAGSITYVNPTFTRLTGYTGDEVLGENPRLFKTSTTPPEVYGELWQALLAGKEWHGEFCNRKKDGSLYWERASVAPVVNGAGAATHYVAVKEDITEQKETEEKLRELSLCDALTGLSNRRGFLVLAEQQIKVSNRIGKGFLLLYADLDGMKWINDTLGHGEGDRALVDTAAVLRRCLRSSDVVARIGGDEFVAMSLEGGDPSGETLRERLGEGVAAHNRSAARPYTLSLSFGIAHYDPALPCTVEELLQRGDALMYEVKRRKKEQALEVGGATVPLR